MPTWLMQTQSALIVLLMLWGVSQRKNRRRHVATMAAVISWDLLLILQIELARGAIAKASQALTNTLWLNIHVTIAVTTVVLYLIMIHAGRKILAGNNNFRKRHRILGWTTLTMRLLTLATSFLAVPEQIL